MDASPKAFRYTSYFPMSFLQGNETVRATGDLTGSIIIDWAEGELRIERGQSVVRTDDGRLEVHAVWPPRASR